MMGDRERLTLERDAWIRLFNRLEAAVSHHAKVTDGTTSDADDALYTARGRILTDATKIPTPARFPPVDHHSTTVAEAAAFERDNHE